MWFVRSQGEYKTNTKQNKTCHQVISRWGNSSTIPAIENSWLDSLFRILKKFQQSKTEIFIWRDLMDFITGYALFALSRPRLSTSSRNLLANTSRLKHPETSVVEEKYSILMICRYSICISWNISQVWSEETYKSVSQSQHSLPVWWDELQD